jgi:hypothetical protein
MSNDASVLNEFHSLEKPSHVSIANGKKVSILGKGKLALFSNHKESAIMYLPSFPFKLLSVEKLTHLPDYFDILSTGSVTFQDCVSKRKIGEGFFLNGLYYISTSSSFSKSLLAEAYTSTL